MSSVIKSIFSDLILRVFWWTSAVLGTAALLWLGPAVLGPATASVSPVNVAASSARDGDGSERSHSGGSGSDSVDEYSDGERGINAPAHDAIPQPPVKGRDRPRQNQELGHGAGVHAGLFQAAVDLDMDINLVDLNINVRDGRDRPDRGRAERSERYSSSERNANGVARSVPSKKVNNESNDPPVHQKTLAQKITSDLRAELGEPASSSEDALRQARDQVDDVAHGVNASPAGSGPAKPPTQRVKTTQTKRSDHTRIGSAVQQTVDVALDLAQTSSGNGFCGLDNDELEANIAAAAQASLANLVAATTSEALRPQQSQSSRVTGRSRPSGHRHADQPTKKGGWPTAKNPSA